MTVIEACNDLAIQNAELADRFLGFALTCDAYHKADTADYMRMVNLTGKKDAKQRRQAQSGVDADIAAIERELSKLGYEVFAERSIWGSVLLGATVSFKERYTTGSSVWRTYPTGKFDLYIERAHQDTKRYPQKADGSYSYAKIAQFIVEGYTAVQAQLKREKEAAAKKSDGKVLAAELKKEFGLTEGSYLFEGVKSGYRDTWKHRDYYETPAEPGKVWMKLGDKQVTPEQARIVMVALKEAELL
jgi:hypothetical protein